MDREEIASFNEYKTLIEMIKSQRKEYKQENKRLKQKIKGITKYINDEFILDYYNNDMPVELIIEKMKLIIEKGDNNG